MQLSQVVKGSIVEGGHRVLVAGLNCRDNDSATAVAIARTFGVSVTALERVAATVEVGKFAKCVIARPGGREVEVIGLVLRRDPQLPVRLEDVRSGVRRLIRYLGSLPGLRTRDVGMVAVGTGAARIKGGFATLLRVLHEEGYPGVVYEPLAPAAQLSVAQMRALGLSGRPEDALPPWRCPPGQWGEQDEREALGVQPYLTRREGDVEAGAAPVPAGRNGN